MASGSARLRFSTTIVVNEMTLIFAYCVGIILTTIINSIVTRPLNELKAKGLIQKDNSAGEVDDGD
jgi:hypothetical protein